PTVTLHQVHEVLAQRAHFPVTAVGLETEHREVGVPVIKFIKAAAGHDVRKGQGEPAREPPLSIRGARQNGPKGADVIAERGADGGLKIALGPLRELEFFLNEAAQVKALVTSLDLIAVHDVRGRAPRDGVDKGLAVRKQLPRLDLDKKLTVELGRAPRVLRGGGRRAVVTPIAIAALGTSLEAL